jgi:predicted outer membrane protein
MIETLTLLVLLADEGKTTLPRHGDVTPVEERPASQENPTDPLFDRQRIATDDPAFVLTAIENSRQGIVDARNARQMLHNPKVRDAAAKIGKQNEVTRVRLEALANAKGWRVPADNPQRDNSFPVAGETRTTANYIINQIAFHEATIAQYRAQIGGKGDAELKRELRSALAGYQENLNLLLRLEL